MSQERIYTDDNVRATSDEINPELQRYEQMTALITDVRNKNDEQAPPTRMQRKFKRLFGSGKETTMIFVQGFKMGSLVGGAFGFLIGTYQAVQLR